MAEFGNYIIYLIMCGAIIGAVASIVKPTSELGKEFVNGIFSIGPVFLAQAGSLALQAASLLWRWKWGEVGQAQGRSGPGPGKQRPAAAQGSCLHA